MITMSSKNRTSALPEKVKARRALFAAIAGFFVDMFDVYLPAIALAPATVYFLPDHATGLERATFAGLVFGISLVGRPLGSIIFGPLGDRIGRRRMTILVALGFTLCTGLIAVLPGYATLGFFGAFLLILLRLLDGVFLGGEYTGANPLAMEYAPKRRRGLYGGLIHVGFPGALAFITVLTGVVLSIFPAGGQDSAYAVWGWRIPFAVGFLLSLALFLYYLTSVPESEIWMKMEKSKENPLVVLFSRKNISSLGLAFLVGSGAWLTMNASVGVFSAHFQKLGVSAETVNGVILTATIPAVVVFPFIGQAAQTFGRARVIGTLGVLNIVLAAPLFGLAVGLRTETAVMWLCAALVLFIALLIWSVMTPFIIELFPPQVRASGYGIGYSLPAIIPAFYSYYMLWLSGVMDYDYTPIVLLAVGGACLAVGAGLSKDLRHVSMSDS